MLALLPVRKHDLLNMRWSQIDLEHPDGALWSIPDENVRTKVALTVPLSKQAVSILREVEIYGDVENGGLVFEGSAGSAEPLSENAIRAALVALGYGGKHTAHGFRSSFSTLAHEKGWRSDLIELAGGRRVGGAKSRYLRSTLLNERRILLQQWADFCDELKAEARAESAPVSKRGVAGQAAAA
jgi:integrase